MLRRLRFFLCALAVIAPAARAAVTSINLNVDQVLIENDPGQSYGNLIPSLTLSFNDAAPNFLTLVVANNTTVNTGGADAGNVLTGVAFQLGTSLNLIAGGSLAFADGTDFVRKGNGSTAGVGALNQDRWGFFNGQRGHFDTVGTLDTDTQISTMFSDVHNTGLTFGGNTPSNALMGSTDFGLLSSVLSAQAPVDFVENSLKFVLKLNNNVNSSLLAAIDAGNVSVSFGSPGLVRETTNTLPPSTGGPPQGGPSQGLPEPASIAVWAGLVGLALITRQRKNRRSTTA